MYIVLISSFPIQNKNHFSKLSKLPMFFRGIVYFSQKQSSMGHCNYGINMTTIITSIR